MHGCFEVEVQAWVDVHKGVRSWGIRVDANVNDAGGQMLWPSVMMKHDKV